MTITIRTAGDEERPAIQREVVQAAWLHSFAHIVPPTLIRAVFAELEPMTCSWQDHRGKSLVRWVACDGDEVVGVIRLGEYGENDLEVGVLHIKPSHHRKGIGKKLWQKALEFHREHGYNDLVVWTMRDADAPKFYKAMGCLHDQDGTLHVGDFPAPSVRFKYVGK